MKGFDSLHLKSAVKSRNNFDISRTHLTTGEFGQITPLFCEETVPGDKFNISADYFSRLAPLVKPTYGRFSFRTMAGFVPYYQIADDADAFIDGKSTFEGHTPIFRFFYLRELMNVFHLGNDFAVSSTSSDYDISYVGSTGTVAYKKFTNLGRFAIKVFNSLGYVLPECADMQTTSTWYTSASLGMYKLNAMPLLAFFKLYNDWCSQSQRYNTSQLTSFLKQIKERVSSSDYSTVNGIQYSGLKLLFNNLKLNYENDYFTSAWMNAFSPLGANESVTTLDVPGNTATYSPFVQSVFEDTNAFTHTQTVSSQTYGVIGQRTLDFLKSFDDWVRRNNYSGSRVVQQVYSRYGIKTSDFRDNYAEIIQTNVSPVQVGDVTSQSDATGAVLGDYAGKAIMSDGKSFSYEAKDFGMLFILGWFTVSPMMSFGASRHVLRNQPLDWYHPEFDGIGADPISYLETYEDPSVDTPSTDLSKSDDVFGFTERYNSYRFGRDQITGDFRDYKSVGMNVWHLGRYLTALRTARQMFAQSSSINTLSPTDSEYNRIFNITSGDVDHFYLTCNFKVSAVRPMLSLNQVPRLGEGDTNVPRNGNTIN